MTRAAHAENGGARGSCRPAASAEPSAMPLLEEGPPATSRNLAASAGAGTTRHQPNCPLSIHQPARQSSGKV
ncbi:MAG TPA: hypothetical protein VNX28_03430 [Gemmataceae bacterium]|nr:hypothetical protein [Gemmataceae bacterium]